MKFTHTIAISMVVGMLFGLPALANEPGSVPPPTACVATKNPLSDAQKRQMGEITDQFELQTAVPRAQLKVAKRQLFELLGNDEIDHKAALALQTKVDSLHANIATVRLNMMLAMHDVLTPVQRSEFKSKIALRPPCPMGGIMPPPDGHLPLGHCGPGQGMQPPFSPMSAGLPGLPPPPFPPAMIGEQ